MASGAMQLAALALALLGLAGGAAAAALPLPPYMQKCPSEPQALNDCAVKQAPTFLKGISNGDRKYGIPVIDPMEVDLVTIDESGFKANLSKLLFTGLSQASVSKVKFDSTELLVHFYIPKLTAQGLYVLDADFRLVHIKGEGECTIEFHEVPVEVGLKYDLRKHKDGLEYMELRDPYADFNTTKVTFQFDNLFNGDKTLGPAMNEMMNENWEELLKTVRPAIQATIAQIGKAIVSGFMRRVPASNYFP